VGKIYRNFKEKGIPDIQIELFIGREEVFSIENSDLEYSMPRLCKTDDLTATQYKYDQTKNCRRCGKKICEIKKP
jgi:hypothetical protein